MTNGQNYIEVTIGFKTLLSVMAPFVARELYSVYGASWWSEGVLGRFTAEQRRDLPVTGDTKTLVGSLDELRCLQLIDFSWREIFSKRLPRDCKNWAIELKGARNMWAHSGGGGIEQEKAARALDTMQLLCQQINPESAEKIRESLRKVRYGQAQGQVAAGGAATGGVATGSAAAATGAPAPTAQSQASPQPQATVGIAGLPSWRTIMEPHPDVAQGNYRYAEFAADLAQVVHGQGAFEYRDPQEFFKRTYITQGMEELLVQAIRRVSGTGGEPVVQLKTAFGGGKTHSMLALYHLMQGSFKVAQVPSLEPVFAKADANIQALVDGVQVAVIVGTALDPSKSKRPANLPGVTVNTVWGEIAYQLAVSAGKPELYDYVKEADKKGVSPGFIVLKELFDAAGPCLVLMDELVAYGRKLEGQTDLPAGTFGNFITFVQEITEAARASKNSMVVASIPESEMEVGSEVGWEVLKEIEHTFGRMEAIWKPVTASEGFEVVRRRLFKDCKDPAARDAVIEAFSKMYNEYASDFPVEAKSLEYKASMAECYPIHPEVFARLYEDWATLPAFQRTRGVLRLMAAVINKLWMDQDPSAMIMPGSLPLDQTEVRDELTRYLSQEWNAIVDSEVDGKKSIAYKSDAETSRYGRLLASRRVARTVFLGSAPDVANQNARGIEGTHIRLGVVQPTENISTFNDALTTLRQKSSNLYADANGNRIWYDSRPNLRRTAEDRMQQMPKEEAVLEIQKRMNKWKKLDPFAALHICPANSFDVPDQQDLRLVVLPLEAPHRRGGGMTPALEQAAEILNGRGTSARIYKNMLVFVAADEASVQPLINEAKRYLAWESILEDRETLNLDAVREREATQNIKQASEGLNTKLIEAYSWVLSPTIDLLEDVSKALWEAIAMPGGSETVVKKAVLKLEQSEQVVERWAPALLLHELNKVLWVRNDDIQVKKLWGLLCTYCYLPRLANYTVLEQAINQGLLSKDYFGRAGDKNPDGTYLGLSLGSGGSINMSDYLVKPAVAKAQLAAQAAQEQIASQQGGTSTQPDPTASPNNPESQHVPGPNPTPGPTPGPVRQDPQTFGLTADLDARRVNRDVAKIVDEIVQVLEATDGTHVTLKLEVRATTSTGFDTPTQRTVIENCKTLHITDFRFTQ